MNTEDNKPPRNSDVRELFGVALGFSGLLFLIVAFVLPSLSFAYSAILFVVGCSFIYGAHYFTYDPRSSDASNIDVVIADPKETQTAAKTSRELIEEIITWVELPFRILWNILVLIAAVSLTVAWIIFLFGSVLGVILLLIFLPNGFFLPMMLLALTVELFPVFPWWKS